MTSEIYFPDHRHMMPVSLIQRDRLLPEDVDGKPERARNARVGVRDVVARGVRPAPYVVIDVARELRIKRLDKLDALLHVRVGHEVIRGQVIAGKTKRNGAPVRGKSVVAPRSGIVAYIGQGRIILQEFSDSVEVESGLNGTITAIQGQRGVTIETYAAVLQGVWGNGKRGLGILRAEPDEGLEYVYGTQLDNEYRGAIVYTKRSLKASTLEVIDAQGFAGVIAPSIEPELIDAALNVHAAILLTEGFGSARMNTRSLQFLSELDGRQVMLDAITPSTVSPTHPEAIITVPLTPGVRAESPQTNVRLRAGMTVNIVGGDGTTVSGRVVDLPKTPVLLDNGLRVPSALIELSTGETRHVPLANIELYG